MPSDNRLKKQKEFDLVFKKGKRLYAETLCMCYVPSDKLKVGFSVGKKHGKSVVRNRLKRILRESFGSFSQSVEGNFLFVFMPKPQKPQETAEDFSGGKLTKSRKKTLKYGYSFENIKKDMEFLLTKGGFLKK